MAWHKGAHIMQAVFSRHLFLQRLPQCWPSFRWAIAMCGWAGYQLCGSLDGCLRRAPMNNPLRQRHNIGHAFHELLCFDDAWLVCCLHATGYLHSPNDRPACS